MQMMLSQPYDSQQQPIISSLGLALHGSNVYYFIHNKRTFMEQEKEIRWVGSSYQDILKFPVEPRKEAGFQLGKVQTGLDPDNWKPFDDVGIGTKEIRIRDATDIYRVMYLAKFEEAIYVLHCFQKKTEATTKQDKAIAETRYRAVVRTRKEDKNDY
jgi:phage-related protein